MATFVFPRTFQCSGMKQVQRGYTLNLHVIVLTENVCVSKFICILHAPSFKSFVTPPQGRHPSVLNGGAEGVLYHWQDELGK